MAIAAAHDIIVHYVGKKIRIPDVDPNRYSYIELLNDVPENVLHEQPRNLNIVLNIRCGIPRSFATIDITNDEIVLQMFKVHENELIINLYVFHMNAIPPNDIPPNPNFGHDEENLGIQNRPRNQEDRIDHNEMEDEWFLSSSDDDEDYEENDEDEITVDSKSEKELDPLKAALRAKMFTYNPKDEIEFEKGMLFPNVDAFRAALKDYVIQKGFPIQRLKNEKSRCIAKCGIEGCPWRIHASPVGDSTTFQIKTYNPQHTCVIDRKNPEATSDWIAKKLIAMSKRKPLDEIEGTHFASYGKLPKYDELLKQSNPECIVKIHYDRPNIEEPNLAYEDRFPLADARYCFMHIYNNFKFTSLGLLLRNYFWQVAKSFNEIGYNHAMESIKAINIEAWRYLMKIPKTNWARHAFGEAVKCGHVTNNFTESFNAWVGDLRGKPILTLVEGLRRKFMKNMHKRRENSDDYCDAAFTKECYQKTYAGMINPVPHEENWPELADVTPTTFLPTIEKGTGHNKRTCQRCLVRAKKGSNTGDQMAIRREKPGRGMANMGLSGDHASENVPVAFSSQGHNPIANVLGGQTQTNAANVQTNVQIQFRLAQVREKPPKTNVTRKKSNSAGSSRNPVTNTERHVGFNNNILDHNEASQTSKSVTVNTGAPVDKQSISSSISIF
ncbi:hypothetical protein ACH5RR_012467 [Cinchona calisaya]|uniref:Transposase MuDR plant domain-containing protein n=1 Tax=Cinchona calisaya TaxID=153742 RepID=A0ABD3A7T5_9GENT